MRYAIDSCGRRWDQVNERVVRKRQGAQATFFIDDAEELCGPLTWHDDEPEQDNYAGATEREWEAVSKPVVRKIAIVGHGRHGKDEFANRVAKYSGLRYVAGTSVYASDIAFWALRMKYQWARAYPNATACWLDRGNHRSEWAEVIGQYNQDDPVKLYRDCLAFQDVLTGIRWRHEFEACRKANLVDMWVFVLRPGAPEDSTCEIKIRDCGYVVANDAGLDQLDEKAKQFAMMIGAKNG